MLRVEEKGFLGGQTQILGFYNSVVNIQKEITLIEQAIQQRKTSFFGWIYLASVMYLYDRKIIGYSYGKHMTADLALEAYQNFEDYRKVLFEYIESWYNRQRIYSALGCRTPQQVKDEVIQTA